MFDGFIVSFNLYLVFSRTELKKSYFRSCSYYTSNYYYYSGINFNNFPLDFRFKREEKTGCKKEKKYKSC